MSNVLIVGGTGLISTGIVTHLLARGMRVSVFNRGQRTKTLPEGVRLIQGDRSNASEFARAFERERFDAVIDMICFTPEQAEASVRAFAGRCEHFLFCSSATVYGTKMPPTPTHRDDCGKFFAYAAMSSQTYGQAYNAMRGEVLTWRQYYREVASALDTKAKLIFVPASWLIAQDPERFDFLAEMSQFHGAYSSAKAQAAVPEFRETIALEAGARETFADMRRRGVWRDGSTDTAYQAMVEHALSSGFHVEDA